MKMPPATIQPPANVMLKEMDPYAEDNVSQAPRPAEHFVLMQDKIVLEKSSFSVGKLEVGQQLISPLRLARSPAETNQHLRPLLR